jgi:hypothetical protein
MNKQASTHIPNPVAIRGNATPVARAINETLGRIRETHVLVKNQGRKRKRSKPQDVPC